MVSLNILLQRMRNAPGLLRDVVILGVVLVLGLSAGTYIFSHYDVKAPWSSSYSFYADFAKAPAVQTKARQEVRIAGVTVGRITSAKPVRGGVRVGFRIDQDQKVYKDARLVIRSKSPLNVLYVALNPGTPAAGRLPEDGTIPVSQTDEFTQAAEILDNLDARSQAAITDLVTESDVALTNAPTTLPKGLDQLDVTAQDLKPVVDALAERRGHLAHLVTSLSQISTAVGGDDDRLASLTASLETTLGVVSSRDTALNASLDELPGVTSTLRTALTQAGGLTGELNPVLDQATAASGKLPGLVDRLTTTVRTARGVLTTAKPVIAEAVPVIADLRPLTGDLRTSLSFLEPVAANLPQATARLTPWLTNLGGFVYNTASSFSLGDANGGMGRANLVVKALEPTGAPLLGGRK